jgi:hypothetical protein
LLILFLLLLLERVISLGATALVIRGASTPVSLTLPEVSVSHDPIYILEFFKDRKPRLLLLILQESEE